MQALRPSGGRPPGSRRAGHSLRRVGVTPARQSATRVGRLDTWPGGELPEPQAALACQAWQVQAKGDLQEGGRATSPSLLLAHAASCAPMSAPARTPLPQGSKGGQLVQSDSLASACRQCTAAAALPGPQLPFMCRLTSVSHLQVPQGFLLQVWSLWAQQAGLPLQRRSLPEVPGDWRAQPCQLQEVPTGLA